MFSEGARDRLAARIERSLIKAGYQIISGPGPRNQKQIFFSNLLVLERK